MICVSLQRSSIQARTAMITRTRHADVHARCPFLAANISNGQWDRDIMQHRNHKCVSFLFPPAFCMNTHSRLLDAILLSFAHFYFLDYAPRAEKGAPCLASATIQNHLPPLPVANLLSRAVSHGYEGETPRYWVREPLLLRWPAYIRTFEHPVRDLIHFPSHCQNVHGHYTIMHTMFK